MKMNSNLMKTYMPKQNNKKLANTKCKESTKKTPISTKKSKGRIRRCKCTQKNHLRSQRIKKVE
jgi:hypothetical protein